MAPHHSVLAAALLLELWEFPTHTRPTAAVHQLLVLTQPSEDSSPVCSDANLLDTQGWSTAHLVDSVVTRQCWSVLFDRVNTIDVLRFAANWGAAFCTASPIPAALSSYRLLTLKMPKPSQLDLPFTCSTAPCPVHFDLDHAQQICFKACSTCKSLSNTCERGHSLHGLRICTGAPACTCSFFCEYWVGNVVRRTALLH